MNDIQTEVPERTEVLTVSIGLILSGLAILVTGVSYLMYMEFTYQWMVWVIGMAFVVVGFITMVWPRAFKGPMTVIPQGNLRLWLIIAIPLAFIVSSQVCGLGLQACNIACHIKNLALIVMAIVVALRISRGQSIGKLLIPMVIIALIPHCVCHAPINTVWHGFMGGYAPTCEMMPLAATLFAVMALRGVRSGLSSLLVLVLFAVMVFIIVGSMLFGFPWTGCVDHPMIM